MTKNEAIEAIEAIAKEAEAKMIAIAEAAAAEAVSVISEMIDGAGVVMHFDSAADLMMANGYDGAPEKMAITFAIANALSGAE